MAELAGLIANGTLLEWAGLAILLLLLSRVKPIISVSVTLSLLSIGKIAETIFGASDKSAWRSASAALALIFTAGLVGINFVEIKWKLPKDAGLLVPAQSDSDKRLNPASNSESKKTGVRDLGGGGGLGYDYGSGSGGRPYDYGSSTGRSAYDPSWDTGDSAYDSSWDTRG
jgi:hypothetical protein